MACRLSLSATESLGWSAATAGKGAGLGMLGSGVTTGSRSVTVISEELEACPCSTPLPLDDAGADTHAVTIKKATSAAPIATRRLGKRREPASETCFRRVCVPAFAGDDF